jgi:hypothetical protein
VWCCIIVHKISLRFLIIRPLIEVTESISHKLRNWLLRETCGLSCSPRNNCTPNPNCWTILLGSNRPTYYFDYLCNHLHYTTPRENKTQVHWVLSLGTTCSNALLHGSLEAEGYSRLQFCKTVSLHLFTKVSCTFSQHPLRSLKSQRTLRLLRWWF